MMHANHNLVVWRQIFNKILTYFRYIRLILQVLQLFLTIYCKILSNCKHLKKHFHRMFCNIAGAVGNLVPA